MADKKKAPLRNPAQELANVVRAVRAFAAALPPQEAHVEAARADVLAACDAALAE